MCIIRNNKEIHLSFKNSEKQQTQALKAANILKAHQWYLEKQKMPIDNSRCEFWGEEWIEKIATTCCSYSCLVSYLTSFHQSQMLMPCFLH